MGELDTVFYTRTSVVDLARAFRETVLQTKSPGRGLLADRLAGPIRFFKPGPPTDPIASLKAPSDYEVQAEIPLTGGFSTDPVVLLVDVVVAGGISAGTLVAVGPAGRRAARVYFDAVLKAFRRLDPQLALGDEIDVP